MNKLLYAIIYILLLPVKNFSLYDPFPLNEDFCFAYGFGELKRRFTVVLVFLVGALLTPPHVFTQLLLASPLVLLYELAICYVQMPGYKLFHSDM
jgi:hypothetical protein